MDLVIKDDLYRYVGKDCEKFFVQLRYFLFTAGFRYTFFLRKTQKAKNSLTRFFWFSLLRQCMLRTGIQIPPSTQIGRGLRIVHVGHIVIHPSTLIGDNFNISQGCLIGFSDGKHRGTPKLGNNICMNANSIIIGNVQIGDNVLIAPGAFINFDVPKNSIVIGNPGQVIPRASSPTDKYIIYKK